MSEGNPKYVEAENVLAVTPLVKIVLPVIVPPVKLLDDVIPVTLKVPPLLFVKIIVFPLYVPPVTNISFGKLKYVVADIVLADNPFVNIVPPLTVPPDNGRKSPPLPELNILQSYNVKDQGGGLSL